MKKDILDEMTKKELIWWVRSRAFFSIHPPLMSDLLFRRWQVKSKEMAVKNQAHFKHGESLDMVERDRLAHLFNASDSNSERLRILNKMEPYEKKMREYIAKGEALRVEDKKIDALYARIEVEREREKESI